MRRSLLGRSLRTLALVGAFFGALASCGSRTGLFGEEPGPADARVDGASEGGSDAGVDRATPVDALPLIDGRVAPDVNRNDCPDADATLIYIITTENELFAFNPPDGSFRLIGRIACPAPAGTTPFSMAVDRQGVAFVLFNDGALYRVSTLTANCTATSFVKDQAGFGTFGMGYATDELGPSETLFVAADDQNGRARGLGRIDTAGGFRLATVGDFRPTVERAELTGTGDGRLFAFYTASRTGRPADTLTYVGEINKRTAAVVAETALRTVEQGQGWAFAFWGGDFYLFTAPDGPASRVTRFRPSDTSVTIVANLGTTIVGAGVSTCAPNVP